ALPILECRKSLPRSYSPVQLARSAEYERGKDFRHSITRTLLSHCTHWISCVSFDSESSTCDTQFRLGWTARKVTFTCGSIQRVFPSISPSSWSDTGAGHAAG